VVQVLRTEGEYVETNNAATEIVRVDDLSHTFIEANAPEIDIEKLKDGMKSELHASAILDHPYHGKITSISLAAREQKDWDKARVEFPIMIEVTDNDGRLKSGMSVVVDVITDKIDGALMLRHEYVMRKGHDYYVLSENGKHVNVEVGAQNEEFVQIKSGVKEGDKVQQDDFLGALKQAESGDEED
jgi:multidrug efflux pump subunit AcrA (membrane-fusion protein)